jgi:mannose/cellobiose epimerase-like protein (N-acyl-D-glucosamine 2-epimerase family)
MNSILKNTWIIVLVFLIADHAAFSRQKEVLDGGFWRNQGLSRIIPYWYDHARDTSHGAFYMNLTRSWNPIPPWDKYPAMISRQVYGFSAAYLLSGDKKYLEVARQGAEYLLKHAWDKQYGGWYGVLTQTGEPKDPGKSVDLQLYTDVGLAMYYFVTGDEEVLSRVKESVRIRRTYAHDKEFGGYYQVLNRDLTVRDSSKSKHSHYGYTGSLLINLAMATGDPEILSFAEELMQVSMEKMTDPQEGWLRGFRTRFDRRWKFDPMIVDGKEAISAGAQLTGSLAFLRLYEMTGKELYRRKGLAIGEQTLRSAWDSRRGGWYDNVERMPPHALLGTPAVSWWIQCYGSFLQLHLYHITGEKEYLDRFEKMESFWNRYLIDAKFGGVFMTVSPDGVPIDSAKAVVWKASYHEMEHALLNYLYLNLYVNQKPAVLHFLLRDTRAQSKHFVSTVDDPSVQIGAVKINGRPWTSINAKERYVILPEAKVVELEVTLVPSSRRGG